MSSYFRKRRTLTLPITLSVVLITLNVGLMITWIVMLAQLYYYATLATGVVLFVLILIGLSLYLVLSIQSVRLHQQQVNFVDSVTHELKSPIAALQLYLETMQMRSVTDEQRKEFYGVMKTELQRLDHLISQLLEVGRLDALGQETVPEDIPMEELLRRAAELACAQHKCDFANVFTFDCEPAIVNARRMVLEIVFGNLLDNAIKYGGESPKVDVRLRVKDRSRVLIDVADNGLGISADARKRIFQMFYRGGNELERRKKGTGLGLYITRTLIHILKGKISVHDREGESGSVFTVELQGKALR